MGDTAAAHKPFPVSWEELRRHAKALAWSLLEQGPWQGIIAITRGGLVPAAIVARELEVRQIETVCITSYEDSAAGGSLRGTTLLKPAMASIGDGSGWLVIDDLVDTGRTLELMRGSLPKAYYATVYAKPAGRPLVDRFMIEVSQDTWIYFPWDIALQYIQPIAVQRKP